MSLSIKRLISLLGYENCIQKAADQTIEGSLKSTIL